MAINKKNVSMPGFAIFGLAVYGNVHGIGSVQWSEYDCRGSKYVDPRSTDSSPNSSTTDWKEIPTNILPTKYCSE